MFGFHLTKSTIRPVSVKQQKMHPSVLDFFFFFLVGNPVINHEMIKKKNQCLLLVQQLLCVLLQTLLILTFLSLNLPSFSSFSIGCLSKG